MLSLNKFSSIIELCIYYSILGIGISFSQSPLNKTIMSIVSVNNKTSASSILTLFRSMGITLAACYASIILSLSISPDALRSNILSGFDSINFMQGLNNIFIFVIFCLIILIIMVTYVHLKKIREKT